MDISNTVPHAVGRDQIISDILVTLHEPHGPGVLVTGEPGVGKTLIMRRVVQEMGTGVRALYINAGPTLRAVPFGALAPYLGGLAAGASAATVYHSVLSAVENSVENLVETVEPQTENTALCVVEDAQDLDSSTTELLAQLAVSGRIKLLVLSRTVPGPPRELLWLWRDGLLQRYDLDPLNAPQVRELCTLILGPVVTTAVSTTVAHSSGGNPMFILALLSQGKRLGHLIHQNGVWLLKGEPPEPGMRLTDLVQSQLRRRTPQERAALETVSLAAPLRLEVLIALADETAVNSLQVDGLLTVGPGPDTMVGLSHPLYGEVLRQGIPLGRQELIRRQKLNLTGNDWHSLDQLLRNVSWALDCGAEVDDRLLLKAASVANRFYDPAYALRAAAAVSGPAFQERAVVEQARALMIQGDTGFALDLADELLTGTVSLAVAGQAARLAAALRLRTGTSPQALIPVADMWAAAVERITATRSGPPERRWEADARLGIRLLRLFNLHLNGRYRETPAELEIIAAHPDAGSETRIVALAMLGDARGTAGEPAAGAQATRMALEMLAAGGSRSLMYQEFVLARHSMCLIRAGEWNELTGLQRQYIDTTPRGLIYFGGALNLITGFMKLRQGAARSALRELVPAVEALKISDTAQLLPMALGLAAWACALSGERDAARGYAEAFEAAASRGSRRATLLGRIHATAARSPENGTPASIAELHKMAAEAHSAGMVALAATAWELAFHLGDDTCLPQLAALTAGFDGAEGRTLHVVAMAMPGSDPAALLEAADLAESRGYGLLAAACLSQAVSLLENRNETQKAVPLRRRVAALDGVLDGARTVRLALPDSPNPLTRREHDVVELASQGYPNRDIADRLHVSVRTVEGHLYRIFTKLGITRREDINHGL